jgi:hypothetical protein
MSSLSEAATNYIEKHKQSLLESYYSMHKEGAVILLLYPDGDLYKQKFMNWIEIGYNCSVDPFYAERDFGLPPNTHSVATRYLSSHSGHLIILTWFYPMGFNPDFSVCTIVPESTSDCFVVTATFELEDQSDVINRYRDFRDKHLMTNATGKLLVNFYYIIGPHLANLIRSHSRLKLFSKKILLYILKFLPA